MRELRQAARRGGAVKLRPGVTQIRSLELPPGATLVGGPASTLRLVGPGPLLHARGGRSITIENVVLEGEGGSLERDRGLLEFEDIPELSLRGCAIRNSKAHGISLRRCGGVFAQNRVERARHAGYKSVDGLGMEVEGNRFGDCGDNGVLVWTSAEGAYEGSRLRNNLIEDIHNFSGGDGPYGNGIGVYRAGSVRVENNRIRRCAYSAVRCAGAHDALVEGNDCQGLGERAMYAEFGAKRVSFRNNRIDDAGAGIGIANSDRGTDFGVATGNVITGLRPKHPDVEFGPKMFWLSGVEGEKNCEISGNRIIGPAWIGVALGGWRQNVRVEDNFIQDADYGIVFATGPDVGSGVIAGNRIFGSRKAAISAFAGPEPVGGDLLAPGGGGRHPRLVVSGNQTEAGAR